MLEPESKQVKKRSVNEFMEKNPITVDPSTSVVEAIELMKKENIRCLPVKYKGRLAGIVTEFDMMQIAEFLLKKKKKGVNNDKSNT